MKNKKRKFNIDLLNTSLERDGASLKNDYEILKRDTNIIFICNCNTEYNNTFLNIVDHGGAFCKLCSNKKRRERTVMTHLSSELYAQFLEGNLTIELKKALHRIKDYNGKSIIDMFVKHAKACNHIIMANWIDNLTFTTLQDEGIV